MADICDRSPCDRLVEAIGRFVFSRYEDPNRKEAIFALDFVRVAGSSTKHATLAIEYCPFCGTRLDRVGSGMLGRFLPLRRKPVPSNRPGVR